MKDNELLELAFYSDMPTLSNIFKNICLLEGNCKVISDDGVMDQFIDNNLISLLEKNKYLTIMNLSIVINGFHIKNVSAIFRNTENPCCEYTFTLYEFSQQTKDKLSSFWEGVLAMDGAKVKILSLEPHDEPSGIILYNYDKGDFYSEFIKYF